MATDAPDDEPPLFVGSVSSRRAGTYAIAAVLWALLLIPVCIQPLTLLFLPYSVPLALLAGWVTRDIVNNRTWQLRIEGARITWDSTYRARAPGVVLTQDILRLTVAHPEDDAGRTAHITLYLRDGSEQLLPPMFTSSNDEAALLKAIQLAVPTAFTRHLS